MEEIIIELLESKNSEREGRAIDKDQIDDNATFNQNMAGFLRIKEELESSYKEEK